MHEIGATSALMLDMFFIRNKAGSHLPKANNQSVWCG